MTHLQKITTLAKKIRKQYPNKKWTDCVKAASKELKGEKTSTKQLKTKKMIGDNHQYFRTQIKLSDGNIYKVGSYSIDINTELKKHQKLIDGYIVNMNNMTAYKTVGTKKLSGTSKKHTDTKSHNINVKIGNIKPKPTIVALSKKIKLDTEHNNHTEAVLKLAKFLKDKEAIETLNFIKKTSDKLGYMNSDLYGIRNSIYNLLMKKAKLKLNGIDYQEIYKSF